MYVVGLHQAHVDDNCLEFDKFANMVDTKAYIYSDIHVHNFIRMFANKYMHKNGGRNGLFTNAVTRRYEYIYTGPVHSIIT